MDVRETTTHQACEQPERDLQSLSETTSTRDAVTGAGCGTAVAATPRKAGSRRIAALALGCVLAGSALGAAAVTAGNQLFGGAPAFATETTVTEGSRTAQVATEQTDTSQVLSAADVYEQNVGATVGITTSVTVNYWGYQTQAAASGSGFVLTSDGYVLTNYHVVEDSDTITVTFFDGTSYDAALVGYDVDTDVAVLKVDAQDLQTVVLGDSDAVRVGDAVYAIGNPLGELTFSLTAGVVSALDRQVTMENGVDMDLMQTDCAINSGSSGGALFNDHGEVVGITNGKYSGSSSMSGASIENIAFAIPVNDALNVAEQIIETGTVSKPYIGVTVTDVSEALQAYGVPQGAAVATVVAGGPAETAGLQENDVVTACNGEAVEGAADLVAYVEQAAVGDVLTLDVVRGGEELQAEVTVGDRADLQAVESAQDSAATARGGRSSQGVTIMVPGFGYGFGYGMSNR